MAGVSLPFIRLHINGEIGQWPSPALQAQLPAVPLETLVAQPPAAPHKTRGPQPPSAVLARK
jgi:hypothetical protein